MSLFSDFTGTTNPTTVFSDASLGSFGVSDISVDNLIKQASQGSGASAYLTGSLNSASSLSTEVNSFTKTLTKSSYSINVANQDADTRLPVVVPRYGKNTYFTPTGYTSDRGPIASIRLLTGNSSALASRMKSSNVNVSSELAQLTSSTGFSKFMVTDVSVQYSEKTQIMTTFGDTEVSYYFGRNPVEFNISGVLFDSLKDDWFAKFIALYFGVFRGTQLAKNFELIELTLPNLRLVGTISSLSHQQNSTRDADIPFSMIFHAKSVVPLSIKTTTGELAASIAGISVFSIGKAGVGGSGYSLSVGDSVGGIVESDSLIPSSWLGSASAFSSAVDDFRSSVFSPVYGVLTSITKVVKSTNGDINSIISSFTSPINKVLGTITSIANEAVKIASLIEGEINTITSVPSKIIHNLNTTLKTLKYSAGVISRSPQTIAQIIKHNASMGAIHHGSAILNSGKKRNKSKKALLQSGAAYSTQSAYSLG